VHLLSHFGRSFHRPRSEAVSYSETLGNAKHDSRAHAERVTNSHRCSQPISHRDRREFTLPFANKLRADREFAGEPTEKL
jgi:hypothetical protein